MTDTEIGEAGLLLLQSGSIVLLFQLLATGFLSLAVHRIVGSELAGEPLGARSASSQALARLFTLVVAGVIAMVLVTVGLVALIIPGLWLAGVFSMVSAVIALEGLGPVQALRRSFTLVRGRWWPTVGFILLVGLFGSVAAQLVQLVALPIVGAGGVGIGAGLGFVVLVVAQGFVVAAIAVMVTLWYLDLRARNEPLVTLESAMRLSEGLFRSTLLGLFLGPTRPRAQADAIHLHAGDEGPFRDRGLSRR